MLLYSLCPWLDELGAEGQLWHHFSRIKKEISLAGCLLAFTCPIDLTMKHLQGQDSACWHLPWQGMPRTYSWSPQTRNATSSIGGDVPTKLQPGLGLLCQEEDKIVRYSLSQHGSPHLALFMCCRPLSVPSWKVPGRYHKAKRTNQSNLAAFLVNELLASRWDHRSVTGPYSLALLGPAHTRDTTLCSQSYWVLGTVQN